MATWRKENKLVTTTREVQWDSGLASMVTVSLLAAFGPGPSSPYQVAIQTTLSRHPNSAVAPNICWSSLWNLLQVSILHPKFFKTPPTFLQNLCTPQWNTIQGCRNCSRCDTSHHCNTIQDYPIYGMCLSSGCNTSLQLSPNTRQRDQCHYFPSTSVGACTPLSIWMLSSAMNWPQICHPLGLLITVPRFLYNKAIVFTT